MKDKDSFEEGYLYMSFVSVTCSLAASISNLCNDSNILNLVLSLIFISFAIVIIVRMLIKKKKQDGKCEVNTSEVTLDLSLNIKGDNNEVCEK